MKYILSDTIIEVYVHTVLCRDVNWVSVPRSNKNYPIPGNSLSEIVPKPAAKRTSVAN